MLIGYVRNFLVLWICYKVDMGHVFFRISCFVELIILVKRWFSQKNTFFVCLEQNVTTKMTAWTMGSFHGFGKMSTLY